MMALISVSSRRHRQAPRWVRYKLQVDERRLYGAVPSQRVLEALPARYISGRSQATPVRTHPSG